MTVWTDNAAAFATRPDMALTARRHDGVRQALRHLVERPLDDRELARSLALAELAVSVERQALYSGIGRVTVARSAS